MLVLILIFGSLCVSHGNVEILEEPSSTFGLENQKIVLKCRFRNAENSTVSWYFSDSKLDDNDSERIVTTTVDRKDMLLSTVNFHLLSSTQGRYFCNASHTHGWSASKHAIVRISFLNEQFVSEPQDKTVSVGETVLLECIPPVGLPAPTVKWNMNNASLILDERMQISESGNLRIDRVSWKDGGTYRCIAQSFAFRRQSSEARLTVRHRPYFVESPLSQSIHIHSSFELGCRAAGEPSPVILWRREPSFLEIPFERTRLLMKGSLHFSRVRLEDAGDYVCRAVSSAGVIEAIAHVTVVSPPGLIETPPSQLYALEGERVELPCSAVGSPTPDVRWVRGVPPAYFITDASASSEGIIVSPSGSLIILSVRPEDSSNYECRASSPAGLTRSLTHFEVKPNPYLNPARFGAVSSMHLIFGVTVPPTPVKLICQFPKSSTTPVSRPHIRQEVGRMALDGTGLSIVWRINGESLHSLLGTTNETFVKTDGSLWINNFHDRDQGNYTCVLFNHIIRRYTTWTIALSSRNESNEESSRDTVPNSLKNTVSNLTLIAIGDTWLAFHWIDLTTESDFMGYKVYYLPVVHSPSSDSTGSLYRSHPSQLSSLKRDEIDSTPLYDKWSSTSDILRQQQVRLTKLIPNTGYWVEVRKVSQIGISEGELYPRIVYTLKNPFQVAIPPNLRMNNNTQHDIFNPIVPYISRVTALDFQDVLSNFLEISFTDVNIRSLTSTEALIRWTTVSSNNILQQIDGFQVDVKSVPMSRCLVSATSSSLSQLSSFPYVGQNELSTGVVQRNKPKSLMSPVHCSLSSDELLEQVLRSSSSMKVPNSGESIRLIEASSSGWSRTRSVVVTRSVSSANPVARAVAGELSPFTCYEIALKAFKDDLMYGRIWSGASRPELALTLDASPSHAPTLVSVEWLPSKLEQDANVTDTSELFNANMVHLKWIPLELHKAHGALTGYMVHFLADEPHSSLSVKMPPDVDSRDIFGLSPHIEYTIYLAAITCRGEGVRGSGHRLHRTDSIFQSFPTTTIRLEEQTSLKFPLWAYGIICLVVLLWILSAVLIPLMNRRQSSKRTRDSVPGNVSFSYPNKSNRRIGWCMFRDHTEKCCQGYPVTTINASTTEEYQPDLPLTLDFDRDRVELTNQVVCTSDLTQRTSSMSEQWLDRRPLAGDRSTSESNSQAERSTRQLPMYPSGIERSSHCHSGLDVEDDAEVYANSDHSAMSNPNSPCDLQRSHNQLSIMVYPSKDIRTSQPQLPDSINIPFPTPPKYHAYYQPHHIRTEPCELDVLINPNPALLPIGTTANERNLPTGSRIIRYSTPVVLGDSVPPYASCSLVDDQHACYASQSGAVISNCQVEDIFVSCSYISDSTSVAMIFLVEV